MQEEIRVLRAIYFQARKSVCSIDRLWIRSSDIQIRQLLEPQREEYLQIAHTAQRLLVGRGCHNIRMKAFPAVLSLPKSEQKMAERRLRECGVAMENSIQMLSRQPIDPKISSLGRQLLLTQQAETARFRQFLS